MKKLIALTFSLLFFFPGKQANAQTAEPRFALIIGVKSYRYVAPLLNSLNDAHDIAASLKSKGFRVVELYDPGTKREMQDAIRSYFALLNGKPNAVGMVFYSGHGMQVKGSNYLIPSQANPIIEADLDDQCLNMDYVMGAIEQAGNNLNIFVLDACRNNPFRSFTRSGENGLSMVNTPKGSYIVYATKPGSVASDGTGRNGLFTSKLLKHLNTNGLKIEEVFKRVAADVSAESKDAQRPWIASDYTGDFFFTTGVGQQAEINQPTKDPKKNDVSRSVFFDIGYGTTNAPTIRLDEQEWTAKNLNVSLFANGDSIAEARTPEEWKSAGEKHQPAWCYYNNDPSNQRALGKLYNWYAVVDPRGLAPSGWHIPNENEWDTMINFFGGAEEAGKSLKKDFGSNENSGTNKSGFNGRPGGFRGSGGAFFNLGKSANWWSATEADEINAWLRFTGGKTSKVFKEHNKKACGYSVRCVKN